MQLALKISGIVVEKMRQWPAESMQCRLLGDKLWIQHYDNVVLFETSQIFPKVLSSEIMCTSTGERGWKSDIDAVYAVFNKSRG